MRLKITYGAKTETVSVLEQNLLAILQPSHFAQPFCDTSLELERAAQAAIRFLAGSNRVLVLLNDYTRPTPNQEILFHLEPELRNYETKYLICLGTHRPAKENELQSIIGAQIYHRIRDRIIQHDYRDPSRHFIFGKTGFGTTVELNRELLWAERLITINSIEPHYFAGYTGGRKCFVPGSASQKTITQNHNLLLHPASAPFSLKNNPVHEDMTEAAKMVSVPVFSIQMVLNYRHQLVSVHYGDLFSSFEKGCEIAFQVYACPIQQQADIILSVLQPPYSINFYQSQRAVEFALKALKPNGIQITVSCCTDGIGNDDFVQVLQSCKEPAELLVTGPPATLGWHKAARLAKIMQRAQLYTVMPGVNDDIIKSVFMHPFHSIQSALDSAFAQLGSNATLYIIPDAGALVPVIQPGSDLNPI